MDRHQAGPAEPFGSYMFSSWMKQGFAFQPKKRAFGCKSTSAKLQVGQVEVGREPGTWPAPRPYPKQGNSTTGTWSPCWPPADTRESPQQRPPRWSLPPQALLRGCTASPSRLCPRGGFMGGLVVLPAPHCPPAEHPLQGASPPLRSACRSSCLAFPRCSNSLPKAPAGAGRNLTENSVRADRSQARTERRARGQASSRAAGMPSSCL